MTDQIRTATTRRSFLKLVPATLGALALAARLSAESTVPAAAPAPALVDEADPTAKALGYKHDATKTDTAKYPQYKAGQTCATCLLYQGKAGEASGPCGALAGKNVAAKGWCMAYAKKP